MSNLQFLFPKMFPKVVFGTSCLGNLYKDIGYDAKKQIIEEIIIEYQLKGETPVFDSAGKYGCGLALETLSKILQDLKVEPNSVKISNKLGWKRVDKYKNGVTNCEPGVWVNLEYDAELDISYQGILDCYHQGNELLAPYRADIVSVHDPDEYIAKGVNDVGIATRKNDVAKAYQALFELKEEQVVKSIGVGSKDPYTIDFISRQFKLDWVMMACHLTVYTHKDAVLKLIHDLDKRGVHIINAAVFNSGFLIGERFYDYVEVAREQAPKLFEWRDEFLNCCKDLNVSPAHVCIQYSYLFPEIGSIALNATSVEQVRNNNDMAKNPLSRLCWETLLNKGIIGYLP